MFQQKIRNGESLPVKIWNSISGRFGIISFAVILALLFLTSILANPIINWIVKPNVINSLSRNNNTTLQIEAIDFSIIQNRIIFYGSKLIVKDSTDSGWDSINVSIPYLSISGVNWLSELMGSGHSIGKLNIEKPRVRLSSSVFKGKNNRQKNISAAAKSESSLTLAKQLSQLLPAETDFLKADFIIINSADVVIKNNADDEITDSIKSLSVVISGLNLNKKNIHDKSTVSPISNYKINIKGYHKRISFSGYDFKISSVQASGEDSNLNIKELSFQSFISDEEFFKRRIYRGDRWKIKIPEINAAGFNLIKLISENKIAAQNISVSNFHIENFINKRLPLNPASNPKMPNEIMRTLGFGLEIEKLKINNSFLVLQSLIPEVQRRAQLKFTNINAAFENISNSPELQSEKKPCIIDASGNLQGAGKLNVNIRYPLLNEQLNFNYKGHLGEMSAAELNSHLEVEDKVKIVSGKIRRINFSSNVENGIASVNIIPLYNDLDIEMLDEEADDNIFFATLLANLLKIRKSNPDDNEKIKSGNIAYVRGPRDTFLDVIWLALLKGLGEVVGF